jgi:hypothetical protein
MTNEGGTYAIKGTAARFGFTFALMRIMPARAKAGFGVAVN